MIDTNTNLSNRFFYVNPSANDESGHARMFPMSRLISMSLSSTTDLIITFDDAGVGDHTLVTVVITAGKGREAMKDVIDAINSNQKVVVFADQFTGDSIISDYVGGNVTTDSGAAGTFTLNGPFSVSGAANFNSRIQFNYETVDAGDGSSSATALNPNLTISFVDTATSKSHVSLANGTIGQIKYIIHRTKSNNVDLVITPASFAAGATLTSDSAGRGIALIFGSDNKWHVLGDVGEFVIG